VEVAAEPGVEAVVAARAMPSRRRLAVLDDMTITRRTAVTAGLAGLAALAGRRASATATATATAADATVTVPGESPSRTNIPVARDPRAAGGRYLALATTAPPPADGWFATYTVGVPRTGPYRLVAIATAPVEQPHQEEPGCYVDLSVSGGPFEPVAGSQPRWYASAPAWGDLSRLDLGHVDLRRGENTVTFRVTEPVALSDAVGFRFLLDRFTLTHARLALAGVHLGDPAVTVGTVRSGEPALLRLRLNGRAPRAVAARFTITDHTGRETARGTVTIPAGRRGAQVRLREPVPGNYRVRATLDGAPGAVVGHFARLPDRRPATGRANRFGVNVFASSLVPPTRLEAFAAAVRDMGAGYVRDGNAWPVAEPRPGRYDTSHYDRTTTTYHRHGLRTLEVISAAPSWATTDGSAPLPGDLRRAYEYAAHLAAHGPATSRALQLSNEPDVDATASTGDQHAAFVKAAALGIAAAGSAPGTGTPLTVLPGIATAGQFQELMLQNGVARYADVWAFHGYPDPAEPDDPEFPDAADEQHALRRLYGSAASMWMTECGAFLPAVPGEGLTPERQRIQAAYLVRSTVEGLAAGNDRQFWFVAPPCVDDGVAFGVFSRDFQPWPAYSAHAAMTALLGAADFAGTVPVEGAVGFRFDDGASAAVTVVWAPRTRRVHVPVPGTAVEVHDLMGARRARLPVSARGTVRVRIGTDPVYLVSDTRPRPRPGGGEPRTPRRRFTAADHIVLSQRYAARNAAPGKEDGDAGPPHGYRLDRTTRLTVDVYNFDDRAHRVGVSARAYGGWTVSPPRRDGVLVPAKGRIGVEFTASAAGTVRPGVDLPLVFEGDLGGRATSPSVARIQLRSPGAPGRQPPLAPVIDRITPGDGGSVTGRRARLAARVTDAVSGVDPAGIAVEVDGCRVPHAFDPGTGRLTARLDLPPGRHELWIRARNNAHAPSAARVTVTST
jgi:hypothetical protein